MTIPVIVEVLVLVEVTVRVLGDTDELDDVELEDVLVLAKEDN